jgi:hypothetical protein
MYLGGIEDNALIHVLCVGSCCGAHRNRLSKTVPLQKACVSFAIHHCSRESTRKQKKKGKRVENQSKNKVKHQSEQMRTAHSASIPSIHPSLPCQKRDRIIASEHLTRASRCTRRPSCTCPPGSTCTSCSCTKGCRRPGAFSPRRSRFRWTADAAAGAETGRERHRML